MVVDKDVKNQKERNQVIEFFFFYFREVGDSENFFISLMALKCFIFLAKLFIFSNQNLCNIIFFFQRSISIQRIQGSTATSDTEQEETNKPD